MMTHEVPGRDASTGGIIEPAAPISFRRKLAAMAITFGLVMLGSILALEIGFRCLVSVTDTYFYFNDPVLGPRVAPNQSGRLIRGHTIDAPFRFNNQGWNNAQDYVIAKPPGAVRVCLVGDSQVESLQVAPEQAMHAVAERAMSRPGRPAQWYSFGNSGWGTNLEYQVIRKYALDYKPEAVVMLFVQNDPFDTSPYLVETASYRPTFYLSQGGDLEYVLPEMEWKPSIRPRTLSQLALWRYFMLQQRLWDKWMGTADIRPGIGGLPLMAEGRAPTHSALQGVARMPLEERKAKTWELIEKLLAASREECAAHGAVFMVAFRGWMGEIDAPLTGKPFQPAPPDVDPFCLSTERASEMGREWLAPITRRLHIPYLDLTEALTEAVRRSGRSHVFMHQGQCEDNHYNAMAHEAAGHALARWVEEVLARRESELH